MKNLLFDLIIHRVIRPDRFRWQLVNACLTMALSIVSMCQAAEAIRHTVEIVIADDGEVSRQFASALQTRFPAAQVIDAKTHKPGSRGTLTFAIGPTALRSLLAQQGESAILSVGTSREIYRAALADTPNPSTSVSAIYTEPAPDDQLHLIDLLYTKRVEIAVLLSSSTEYLRPILQQSARQKNVTLTIEHVERDDSLNRTLNQVSGAPVLLVMPDLSLFNRENMRTILITAYRHNQAVVGFSKTLVKAGALASVYSNIEDIADQVQEIVNDYDNTNRLPEPSYPKYFSVAVNDAIARSLNIVVRDEARNFSRKSKK